MKLSVIIVNYNVKHYLCQCLESLKRALKDVEAEVIVVDNHSRDGSIPYVKALFPDVVYVESNHNLGFARANNVAIRQSKGSYVLLLNPDTIVGEQTVKRVLGWMEKHPDAGAAGVKMLKADGSKAMESRRGFPTPMTAFYKMTGLCSRFPTHRRLGRYYMGFLPWEKPAEIEVVSGAFCMVQRAALEKVGLLDEDFFMYGEDIDLSYRLIKEGYHNWYLPENILHYKGESTQKSSFRYVHVFYEAMLIFFKKHYGGASLWLTVPIKMAIYLKAALALIQMQTQKARKALGFFSPRRREPEYVFLGAENSLCQCRELARKKGLTASFVVADSKSMPNGHLDCVKKNENAPNTRYVVYDVEAFSYDEILDIFEKNHVSGVFLGTYHPKTQTIVTAEEILR